MWPVKIEKFTEIWQVLGKYGKWQEMINMHVKVSSRKSNKSSDILAVAAKYMAGGRKR